MKAGAALALAAMLAAFTVAFLSSPGEEVVVYCAQDQVYAEEIFREFEKETGIRVRALFDGEAVKTVGLANRLLAEQSHPRCDVFWGNEEMRARQLKDKGIFADTNGLAFFGYRSRRVVVNTNKLAIAHAPRSLLDLTNSAWRGKVALAYPQFGTTAAHFHALREHWGSAGWEAWCRALAANAPFLVDGNSVVVKLVGRGEAWVGLTDSDDIAVGQAAGLPIAGLALTPEALLIPNTVGVIRNAPHPANARRLQEHLLREEISGRLVLRGALEGKSPEGAPVKTMDVRWDELLRELRATTEALNRIFLK
jgi:iron(III) transport system substrate-binding protein